MWYLNIKNIITNILSINKIINKSYIICQSDSKFETCIKTLIIDDAQTIVRILQEFFSNKNLDPEFIEAFINVFMTLQEIYNDDNAIKQYNNLNNKQKNDKKQNQNYQNKNYLNIVIRKLFDIIINIVYIMFENIIELNTYQKNETSIQSVIVENIKKNTSSIKIYEHVNMYTLFMMGAAIILPKNNYETLLIVKKLLTTINNTFDQDAIFSQFLTEFDNLTPEKMEELVSIQKESQYHFSIAGSISTINVNDFMKILNQCLKSRNFVFTPIYMEFFLKIEEIDLLVIIDEFRSNLN